MNPHPQYAIAQQNLEELRRDAEGVRLARQLRREWRRAGASDFVARITRRVLRPDATAATRPTVEVLRPAAVEPCPVGSERGPC